MWHATSALQGIVGLERIQSNCARMYNGQELAPWNHSHGYAHPIRGTSMDSLGHYPPSMPHAQILARLTATSLVQNRQNFHNLEKVTRVHNSWKLLRNDVTANRRELMIVFNSSGHIQNIRSCRIHFEGVQFSAFELDIFTRDKNSFKQLIAKNN